MAVEMHFYYFYTSLPLTKCANAQWKRDDGDESHLIEMVSGNGIEQCDP
jgi:hypothetical protein